MHIINLSTKVLFLINIYRHISVFYSYKAFLNQHFVIYFYHLQQKMQISFLSIFSIWNFQKHASEYLLNGVRETLRFAIKSIQMEKLQYTNGKMKECDELIDSPHSFFSLLQMTSIVCKFYLTTLKKNHTILTTHKVTLAAEQVLRTAN